MSFGSEFGNKGSLFNWHMPKDYPFRKLAELADDYGTDIVWPIKALYYNPTNRFGPTAAIATEGCIVNVPTHRVEQVRNLINSPNAVAYINEGTAGFKIRLYENSWHQMCYTVDFMDYNPDMNKSSEQEQSV